MVCCYAILWLGLVSLTISLKAELYDRLYEYCRRYNIKTSHFIARLVKEYLDRVDRDGGSKA